MCAGGHSAHPPTLTRRSGRPNNTRCTRAYAAIHLPIESNPLCEGCQSAEIDPKLYRWFGVPVCQTCRVTGGDRYRMVTKGEAKEVTTNCASLCS